MICNEESNKMIQVTNNALLLVSTGRKTETWTTPNILHILSTIKLFNDCSFVVVVVIINFSIIGNQNNSTF